MTDEIQTRTLPETEHSDLLDRMETYQNLCFSEGYYGSAIVLQEARAEIIRLKSCAAQSPRKDLWACTGCGSQKTIEQIKSENPEALSCCPERKMATLGTAGAVEADYETNVERLHEMLQNREEFIANQGLWKEFSAYLAEPSAPSAALDPVTVETTLRLVRMVRALLRYTNPCNVPEDHSQQWQAVHHQCDVIDNAEAASNPVSSTVRVEQHDAIYLRGWNEGIELAIETLEKEGWYTPQESIRELLETSPVPQTHTAVKCSECDRDWADLPSKLCPGCQAYREHQR